MDPRLSLLRKNTSGTFGGRREAMSTLGKLFCRVQLRNITHCISRISVPNARMSLDLSNHGAGPDIEIWGQWEGLNQLWTFDEGKLDTIKYTYNNTF